MGEMLATVARFMEGAGWVFEHNAEIGALGAQIAGENGRFTLYVEASEARQQLVAYSLCPVRCPAERRAAMAEVVARINWGLVIGNFEIDIDDGEVRFKTSADYEATPLSVEACAPLIYPNVLTMDRYLPAVLGAIYGTRSPAELVADVEGSVAGGS